MENALYNQGVIISRLDYTSNDYEISLTKGTQLAIWLLKLISIVDIPTTMNSTPKSSKDSKWPMFYGFCLSEIFDFIYLFKMDVTFLLALMNSIFHPCPNLIEFGLNLNLVGFFKVIMCSKFHWMWTKSHVSYMKTPLICNWKAKKNCKGSIYFIFWDIYTWDW